MAEANGEFDMTRLSANALKILQELQKLVEGRKVVAGDPDTYVGYSVVLEAVGLQSLPGHTIGESLDAQGLGELATWIKAQGHPAATGLIVNKAEGTEGYNLPGKGYFKAFGKKPTDFAWWKQEIEQTLEFDWSGLITSIQREAHALSSKESALFVGMGDPQLHLNGNAKDASLVRERFAWWNLPKAVKPGDRVLIYVTEPVSAFVAVADVGGLAADLPVRERNEYFVPGSTYHLADVQELKPRVFLPQLKEQFPEWGFVRRPQAQRVRADVEEQLLALLGVGGSSTPPPSRHPGTELDLTPATRIVETIQRVERDSDKARKVKRLHDGVCQICASTIELPGGRRYAEACHIIPRGEDGPDEEYNILCLCPTCHVKLDYGAITVPTNIRTHPDHQISPQCIEWHKRKWGFDRQ